MIRQLMRLSKWCDMANMCTSIGKPIYNTLWSDNICRMIVAISVWVRTKTHATRVWIMKEFHLILMFSFFVRHWGISGRENCIDVSQEQSVFDDFQSGNLSHVTDGLHSQMAHRISAEERSLLHIGQLHRNRKSYRQFDRYAGMFSGVGRRHVPFAMILGELCILYFKWFYRCRNHRFDHDMDLRMHL